MSATRKWREAGRLAAALAILASAARPSVLAAEPRPAMARADTLRPPAPVGPADRGVPPAGPADRGVPRAPAGSVPRRMPLPNSVRSRPAPPAEAAAALERSRHVLLDVRPFDFTAWKQELRGAFSAGPAADLWVATECRRCALVMAGRFPADSLLSVIETGVTLAPSLAFDDSLLDVCDRIGREPPAMQRERDLAARRNRLRLETPDSEDPRYGDYVYVDELPEAIQKVPPAYPEAARQAKVEGTVMLQVLVGKDGRVRDVKVVKSIALLDDAAIDAARQWLFKPALAKSQPVAVWVAVPMAFALH